MERGNLPVDVKGAFRVVAPRGTEYRGDGGGADEPVVAMNSGNAEGAKGLAIRLEMLANH